MERDRTGLKRKEPDHGEKDELPALHSYRAASRCALSLGRPPPGRLAAGCLLYRQADGSFSGRNAYAAYTMQIAQTGNGAEVEFTLDGETRRYRLESKAEGMSDPGVKIEQDGVVILPGPRWATPATPSCGGRMTGALPTR